MPLELISALTLLQREPGQAVPPQAQRWRHAGLPQNHGISKFGKDFKDH